MRFGIGSTETERGALFTGLFVACAGLLMITAVGSLIALGPSPFAISMAVAGILAAVAVWRRSDEINNVREIWRQASLARRARRANQQASVAGPHA